MSSPSARIAVCVACVVCGLGGTAHADKADQLFKKGKKLLAEKKYAEACGAFEDSDRLDPAIGTKLNVAKCYEEWGKLAIAWRWFSDAEQMAKNANDERAAKIHRLIEELDPTVPRLTVRLPKGANIGDFSIKLDGVDLDKAAIGTERRVDPGPHQIDYIVNGTKQTKTVPVERGGSSEVTLDLPQTSQTSSPKTGPPAAAAGAEPDPTRRLLGLGVSSAGGLTVVIAGIVTLRARSDYKYALSTHCRGDTNMCDAAGLAVTHGARHRANIATIATIGGLAAVGGGLYLYFTAPKAASSRTEHALYVAPSIDADASGVVFGGAF
jgi:hypothetical protein